MREAFWTAPALWRFVLGVALGKDLKAAQAAYVAMKKSISMARISAAISRRRGAHASRVHIRASCPNDSG
jgi:hypothetical protein